MGFVDIMNESTNQTKLDSIAIGISVITKCFLLQEQLQSARYVSLHYTAEMHL